MKNNAIGYGVTLICGVALGVCATYKYFEKNFNKRLLEEIDKAKIYYKELDSSLRQGLETMEKESKERKNQSEKDKKADHVSAPTQVNRRAQYESLAKTYASPGERIDYHALSRKKSENVDPEPIDLSQYEHPMDSDENIVLINKAMWESATPHYEKIEVTYYEGDDVFIREDTGDEVDPDESCGDIVLDHISEEEPNMAYSRNYNNSTDYAVHRVYMSYRSSD